MSTSLPFVRVPIMIALVLDEVNDPVSVVEWIIVQVGKSSRRPR